MDWHAGSEGGSKAHRTAPEIVANGVRDAILSGVVKGGQPLRQNHIAEEFGVSGIAVREALRQLETDGLVVIRPRRGAVAAELTYEQLREVVEIRIALETLAIETAIPHVTETALSRAVLVVNEIDGEENLFNR